MCIKLVLPVVVRSDLSNPPPLPPDPPLPLLSLSLTLSPWMYTLHPNITRRRTFSQFTSRTPDVLLGLKSHLDQLNSAQLPLSSLAAALADALNMCTLFIDAAVNRPRCEIRIEIQPLYVHVYAYTGYHDT